MKTLVLAIGIDNYKNVTRLHNCVKDVENILDILTDKYDFEKANIKKLYNNDANSENIIFSLEDYLSNQSSGDNILIIFSGHGDFDAKLDLGYFLPVDCLLDNKSTYLPNSTLFNYIKAFEYRHVLLISDTCFSGSLFTTNKSITTPDEKLFEIPSKWALTSGRIEKVIDGIPGKNSPFAEAIISNLKSNSNPLFSTTELTRKVISEVASIHNQIPRGAPLQVLGDKGGEFFFKLKMKSHIMTSHKSITVTSDHLDPLMDLFIEYSSQLEEAENQNKQATVRRIKEELDLCKNAIKREIIKTLELGKNEVQKTKKLQNIFGDEVEALIMDLKKINIEKILSVKNQNFEQAANARDKEKKSQEKLLTIIRKKDNEILGSLMKSEDTLEQDYGLISLLADSLPSQNRTRISTDLDNYFTEVIFQKYLKNKHYTSQLKFNEKIRNLYEEYIPNAISNLIYQDDIEISLSSTSKRETNNPTVTFSTLRSKSIEQRRLKGKK